jgi:hypothetical protein
MSAATQSARSVARCWQSLGTDTDSDGATNGAGPSCWAYQERALRQLREHAYQKSRFYHDYLKVFLRRRGQHSLR